MSSAPPPISSSPGCGGGQRDDRHAIILVVDRDPHVRELESYFLNEAGYGVEFADDGVVALELARRIRPDIVITEVLVPKMDGLALCRAIKSDPATQRTCVLMFSILAASGRAREAGADAFLLKPLAERRLVDTVRTLLASRARSPQSPSVDSAVAGRTVPPDPPQR